MVVQAYAVHIGVTLECRRMESEMVGDGWGHVDEAYGDRRWSEMVGGVWTRCMVIGDGRRWLGACGRGWTRHTMTISA